MKILVTGAAGYVGSILCETLLAEGHHVTALDNFRHGVKSLSHLAHNKNLEIVRGDARLVVPWVVKDSDVLIPLAALVGERECKRDVLAAESTNIGGVEALLDVRRKDQLMIYPNTNSGYGTSGEPVCTEESPLRPISLYGRTKCKAEQLVTESENWVVFRLATVFGMSPRMRWDLLVNDLCRKAAMREPAVLYESDFRRNYIHVRDVARAFSWALARWARIWRCDKSLRQSYESVEGYVDSVKDQVFNLGLDDANLTKLQLCEKIRKHKPEFKFTKLEYAEDPDKRDYFVSNEKIKKAGFLPRYSLDDGIDELLKGAEQWK